MTMQLLEKQKKKSVIMPLMEKQKNSK